MTDLGSRWPSLDAAARSDLPLPPLSPGRVLWASLDRRRVLATAALMPIGIALLAALVAPTSPAAWTAVLVGGLAAAYVVGSYLPRAGGSPLASPCALAGAMLLVAGVSMLAQPGAEQLLLGSGAIVLAALQRALGNDAC
ncbi:hypothetical protein GCM10027425_25840 [Alteromonas gracilis]